MIRIKECNPFFFQLYIISEIQREDRGIMKFYTRIPDEYESDYAKIKFVGTRAIRLLVKYDSIFAQFKNQIDQAFCLFGGNAVEVDNLHEVVGGLEIQVDNPIQVKEVFFTILVSIQNLQRGFRGNDEYAVFKTVRHELRHFVQFCIVCQLTANLTDAWNVWRRISKKSIWYFDDRLELDAFMTQDNVGRSLQDLYDYILEEIEALDD